MNLDRRDSDFVTLTQRTRCVKVYSYKKGIVIRHLSLPGPMLVLRELHHVSRQVTELEVWEAIVPEVFQ